MTGAYCLVQGRVWRFYQRNKARLDPLSSTFTLKVEVKNPTQIRQIYVYSLRGVMEICRFSTQPKANAFIDCIYHVIIQPSTPLTRSYPLLYPCRFTPPCRCDAFQHLTTYLDAFRQVWHVLRYIYYEQDGTDPNICNRNDVKMVTSDLSARINDVLRYVGITRNMNAYMILSQALTLIAEDEDRLRAVEKEIYTPIADKTLRGPRAVQSTVRRASKVAWDFFPDRVQELAGYPLNGRPSAVTMLELLYNGVARYDDLSILK